MDKKIKTLKKCEHDKPDIVLWKKDEKKCFTIAVRVCLDVNIKNIELKVDNYLPLVAELYNHYAFEVVPIVIGATSFVTNHIFEVLKKLDITHVQGVPRNVYTL